MLNPIQIISDQSPTREDSRSGVFGPLSSRRPKKIDVKAQKTKAELTPNGISKGEPDPFGERCFLSTDGTPKMGSRLDYFWDNKCNFCV